jgi:hypothetical protein
MIANHATLLLSVAGLLGAPASQPPSGAAKVEPPLDWRSAEAGTLGNAVQVTFPDRFVRAGESYFDHATPPKWVVFQAIPVPPAGGAPDANYSMYVARLERDASGRVTGIGEPRLVSAPGSANTCGWFDPVTPGRVIFGSTLMPPGAGDAPGYSRDRQRYSWQFPPEMEVVAVTVDPATGVAAGEAKPLFARPGYDAECSFSPCGRFLLYTHVDPANNDPNLWVYDTKTTRHYPLVTAKGYDGGPFWSPDGKSICYRSDRKGNNVLQLFVAELAFGDEGDKEVPIGVTREVQLTFEVAGKEEREQAVSWCPFYHPSGAFVVYATSEVGHQNYEVFAIDARPETPASERKKRRVTTATGFDGLPVFSADGKLMMWTSQRGPKLDREARPSSQLWIADWLAPAP